MTVYGYARFSDEDTQTADPQILDLKKAGCEIILEEGRSGADTSRPVLRCLLAQVKRGDTIIVVALDRLGRNLEHLISTMNQLREAGVEFKSLAQQFDTTTAQGKLIFLLFAWFAELELERNHERTRAGIRAAVAKGKKPGNPGLIAGDHAAKARVQAAKAKAFQQVVMGQSADWLPAVKELRPALPWSDVAGVIKVMTGTETWTIGRLRRAAREAVRLGLAKRAVLGRTPPLATPERLEAMARGIAEIDPTKTYDGVASIMTALGERTLTGSKGWTGPTVRRLLERRAPASIVGAGVGLQQIGAAIRDCFSLRR